MAATKKRSTKRRKSTKRRVSGRLSTKTLNDLIRRLKVTSKVSRKHKRHSKKGGSKKSHRSSKKRGTKKARKTTL